MAASLPIVTVSISPEVLFSGTYSVKYLEQSNLFMFLKVNWYCTREILNSGERWQLRSP